MKKKICPYCDQAIKDGIYCKGCRRIVLKPVIWDVDYYLNERHPASETNCQYHGDLHTGKMTSPKSNVSKSARPKAAAPRPQAAKSKRSPRKGIRAKLGLAGAIYLCIIIIGVGVNLFNHFAETSRDIGKLLNSMTEAKPEPESNGTWEEKFIEDDSWQPELSDWERSDQEVKEAGIPCNGYGHLNIRDSEVLPLFDTLLSETSFQADCTQYSYNQFIDETTWYNTIYEYVLVRNEDYCGYISLYFDTVDGRMHGMDLIFENKEDLYEMADLSINLLTELGVLEEPQTGRSLFDEALEKDSEGMERFQLGECLEISCMEMDGEYYMMYIGAKP